MFSFYFPTAITYVGQWHFDGVGLVTANKDCLKDCLISMTCFTYFDYVSCCRVTAHRRSVSLQRHGTVGWSVVCDRVISWSYSLPFLQVCHSLHVTSAVRGKCVAH